MRPRIILLSAGLVAYFIGASVHAYLRYPDRSNRDVGCRIVVVAKHPRVALSHPLKAIEYLVFATAGRG
ncbi:MAG: hypothetical protein H7Z38_02330 [Rubrivivax sp.]|nr:hypothetical protein [Pyrinomonadaceae bacterium]